MFFRAPGVRIYRRRNGGWRGGSWAFVKPALRRHFLAHRFPLRPPEVSPPSSHLLFLVVPEHIVHVRGIRKVDGRWRRQRRAIVFQLFSSRFEGKSRKDARRK